MGQTLTTGVYLPDEGERNCYTGLAGNWQALDNHLGNANIHVTYEDKQAWNNHIADTVKHVTAEDKQAWNGKADASALTAHTGDTTIHVTAEDKAKWDAVTGKANDADVVHKSGDETVGGTKTFKDMIPIDGDYLGDEASNNQRTNICLRSNRDTAGKSGAYITRFRQNRSQGALQTNDLQMIGFDVLENEVRTNNVFSIQCSGWVDNVPTKIKLLSTSSDSTFGSSARPSKINDLNPSSLSMPDLSNGIDISSYLDTSQSSINYYTPSVDGWISIKGRSDSNSGIAIIQGDFAQGSYNLIDFGSSDRVSFCALPVKAGVQVEIWFKSVTTLDSAKFFPCLGNV